MEELNSLSVVDLRNLAKSKGVENTTKMKKADLIIAIMEKTKEEERAEENIELDESVTLNNKEDEIAEGVLELLPDGYGFLRGENYLSTADDVYVSPTQIKRFRLKTGDKIKGITRKPKEGERFPALIYVISINNDNPEGAYKRKNFDDLIPIYPNEKINLEALVKDPSARLIDLVAPIGKGQRGMIVAPPKVGKTTLLKNIANAITDNNENIELIVLLIDERPEEVTDIRRSVTGDVIASNFDEMPEHHIKVAEIVLERAKRLVEQDKDVVILLDSITRLARAYNIVVPSSGKTLSGGFDPSALYKPKKFFGAARNTENAGSLTIIATALIDTGSRMDDVIFEEFKGTGNMEVVLDRTLADRRIFPAINIYKSGTRHDDLLLSKEELEACNILRNNMNNNNQLDSSEKILEYIKNTKNNEEFVKLILKNSKEL
ncbi:MAG: transcription termination factor Rho [Bacilli bacterium]|nr:transcription termination factor Rho [Bacilli bacterium]